MKIQNNIYQDKEFVYYVDNNKKCDFCFSIVQGIMYIKIYWDRQSFIKYYCLYCKDKQQFKARYVQELKGVIVIDTPPINSTMMILSRPTLSSSNNVSVFDIGEIDKLGGSTIDNTRYSGRSEKVPEYLIRDDDPKVLTDMELDKFLADVKASKLIGFDDQEIKLLEDHKDPKILK